MSFHVKSQMSFFFMQLPVWHIMPLHKGNFTLCNIVKFLLYIVIILAFPKIHWIPACILNFGSYTLNVHVISQAELPPS